MMDNAIKEVLALIGMVLGLIGLVPYVIDIFRHKTKPHSFSWLIWAILTAIGFAGQTTDHGGAGTWVTGLNCLGCISVFLLSLKYGERIITKTDWMSFVFALTTIPVWLVTKTPLYSMIMISLIDALGFYPTFRKSWDKPEEETLSSWILAGLMYSFSLLSLENYSLVTTLYPLTITITNYGFCGYILWRRYVLKVNHDN